MTRYSGCDGRMLKTSCASFLGVRRCTTGRKPSLVSTSSTVPEPRGTAIRAGVVPDRILGRVVATFRMLGWGALPLGAAIGGAVGEAFGLRAVYLGAAAATLLLLPTRLLITDGRIALAEQAAEAERLEAAGA